MPTLAATAKWANIERSLTAYIQAEIVVAAGLTVRFPGEPGMQGTPTRWIEADWVTLGAFRGPGRTQQGIGHQSIISVDLAHFERLDSRFDGSGNADLYSLTEMLDTTRAAFALDAVIPLRDYEQGGNPQVAVFQLYQMPAETAVTTPPDLRIEQRTLSIPLLYDEDVI